MDVLLIPILSPLCANFTSTTISMSVNLSLKNHFSTLFQKWGRRKKGPREHLICNHFSRKVVLQTRFSGQPLFSNLKKNPSLQNHFSRTRLQIKWLKEFPIVWHNVISDASSFLAFFETSTKFQIPCNIAMDLSTFGLCLSMVFFIYGQNCYIWAFS